MQRIKTSASDEEIATAWYPRIIITSRPRCSSGPGQQQKAHSSLPCHCRQTDSNCTGAHLLHFRPHIFTAPD
eukprot:1158441-Pelagomonas_calceolata.AAC.2